MDKRILLYNPPGKLYQRGEDRCQAEVESSSAMSLRPPNDLGYLAAVARQAGWQVKLEDYPAAGEGVSRLLEDVDKFAPAIMIASITGPTLVDDLEIMGMVKDKHPQLITMAKGAYFTICPDEDLQHDIFQPLDVALVGEAEAILMQVLRELANVMLQQEQTCLHGNSNLPAARLKEQLTDKLKDVPGLILFNQALEPAILKTGAAPFLEDLDSLPFPARDLIDNRLYLRPDTGEPQATIQVSRGCPSSCTFCLSPIISGKKLRRRSVTNVVAEIEECVVKYGITNFFFRADTFTMDKKWVISLCQELIRRQLPISWVANSRVDTVDEERLKWMKQAGCWLVAFGFEVANQEIQQKIKKEIDKEQALQAVRLCRKLGLKTYGFFMLGLPWESTKEVKETLELAVKLDCDFHEVHLAIPFEGTPLYEEAQRLGLIDGKSVGHNYFSNPLTGTVHLSREELLALRKAGLRRLYLNPRYIWRTVRGIKDLNQLRNYLGYGVRLLQNLVKG